LTSSVNDQLNFNKILEKQLAQIAATVPINNNGKIPAQLEKSCKNVNSVTTRAGAGGVRPLVGHHILTEEQKKKKGEKMQNHQKHMKWRYRKNRQLHKTM
jgi:hypothetical protein